MLNVARLYGGIGSMLSFISIFFFSTVLLGMNFLPYISIISNIISIAGFVLVVVAVKIIADVAKDRTIFTNYLLFVALQMIGYGISMVAILNLGFDVIKDLNKVLQGDLSEKATTILFMNFIILWILSIIGAIFMRRSFVAIAVHTKVNLFATLAMIYLIGSIFTIFFGIGGILVFIAYILQIVAFFSLPKEVSK